MQPPLPEMVSGSQGMQLPLKSPQVYPSQQPVEHASPAPLQVGVGVGVGAAQWKVVVSQLPEQQAPLVKQRRGELFGVQGNGVGVGDADATQEIPLHSYPGQHGVTKHAARSPPQDGLGLGDGVANGFGKHSQ